MHGFTHEIEGHLYRATWRQLGENHVEVRSEYGRQTAVLDGRDPGDVARTVLGRLVPKPQR